MYEKEYKSPIDHLIKSLEYGIKSLKQYQANKRLEHQLNKKSNQTKGDLSPKETD